MSPSHASHDADSADTRPRLQVELEILRGRARQKRRPVRVPAFLIGAASDCDLVLGDPQFPQVYAYLRKTDEGVTLRQIGGGPELTLNGVPIARATLADGDRIRTGPYEFQVHLRWEASTPTEKRPAVPEATPTIAAIDRVEEHSAVLEVETLLQDIRQALFPSSQIRLYIDPEMELREANLQALGLGSAWHSRRQMGG